MRRIAIVGGSVAGLRAGQALRANGFDGELTVVGEERHFPYRRPPLSKELLAGDLTDEDCRLPYADLEAEWVLGVAAESIDLQSREVILASSKRVPFDRLVVATGCGARPWPGVPLPASANVFSIRTLDDTWALLERVRSANRAVVLGAGFIGCEVASTLRTFGLEVSLVEEAELPMRPLGAEIGRICADLHAENGVDLRLGARVTNFGSQSDRITFVELSDGTRLAADLVVVATGSQPRTEWLRGRRLSFDNGLACDATCAALGTDVVFGAGDVVSFPSGLADGRRVRIEHWSNAVEQAACCARNLLLPLQDRIAYDPVPSFWSDQHKVRIQSVGFPALADHSELLEGKTSARRFVSGFFLGNRLVGAVAFDMPKRMLWYRRQVGMRAGHDAVAA